MMQHGPGLAASPPVRNNLEVGRRGILFLRFSAVGGQSLYEAAVRVLLFEQRRSAGSHSLVEQQTLPQTTAPNHCYGYRCTIPRRSVPISRLPNCYLRKPLGRITPIADTWTRVLVHKSGSGKSLGRVVGRRCSLASSTPEIGRFKTACRRCGEHPTDSILGYDLAVRIKSWAPNVYPLST